MSDADSFARTICSICYEYLKPIVEDLQLISICGHVFHEICLQQWFEYCSSSSKINCPVCKQSCVNHNATRLYFQSVGDQCDSASLRKPAEGEEDVEVLRGQVSRLVVKVSGFTQALQCREKELRELNEKLCFIKEQTQKEVALKNEALSKKAILKQKLHYKSEELGKSQMECVRFQQSNTALAKEIAILKLVSNFDLEQEEVLKLASLGNEANNRDTIENLCRSLVSHKRSYKELMAKCNILGRCEARLQKKLEKAKVKLKRLKMQVQELETEKEVKENDVLRSLKASKRAGPEEVIVKTEKHCNPLISNNRASEETTEISVSRSNKTFSGLSSHEKLCHKKMENVNSVNCCVNLKPTREANDMVKLDKERIDLKEENPLPSSSGCSNPVAKHEDRKYGIQESVPSISAVCSVNRAVTVTDDGDDDLVFLSESRTCYSNDRIVFPTCEKVTNPRFNIRTETSTLLPLSEQENVCFSGGLLGPDGTKWHLGKWCKRGKGNGKLSAQDSSSSGGNGSLISVGADGRGGRVKVIRSTNKSSLIWTPSEPKHGYRDDKQRMLLPREASNFERLTHASPAAYNSQLEEKRPYEILLPKRANALDIINGCSAWLEIRLFYVRIDDLV